MPAWRHGLPFLPLIHLLRLLSTKCAITITPVKLAGRSTPRNAQNGVPEEQCKARGIRMRVVLTADQSGALEQALYAHGLPANVRFDADLGEGGLLVVITQAQGDQVGKAADHWLRQGHLPDAFLVGRVPASRLQGLTQPWWPAGVCDVIEAPDQATLYRELALRLTRLAELETLLESGWLRSRAVGDSPVWRSTLREIAEIGRFGRGACLLLGESGCGKELLARLLHDVDPVRQQGEFVVVDCTTLSPELSGSELFGHAKGAFTHALTARDGAVALADGGTLFLDEIGELEVPLQARLLRLIQERTYKRVGEDRWRSSDFRLVCATNRPLEDDVQAGRFRGDLFFRISQWTVRAPALAQRREDIPALVTHFLAMHNPSAPRVMPEVMDALAAADYPGNVRELRNVVLRMAERAYGWGVISTGVLPGRLPAPVQAPANADTWEEGLQHAVECALHAGVGLKGIGQLAESIAVQAALRLAGSTGRAAELLGVTPRALQLRAAQERNE